MRHHLASLYQPELEAFALSSLRYLAHYSTILIDSCREHNYYREGLVAHCAVSHSGFWGVTACIQYEHYFAEEFFLMLNRDHRGQPGLLADQSVS